MSCFWTDLVSAAQDCGGGAAPDTVLFSRAVSGTLFNAIIPPAVPSSARLDPVTASDPVPVSDFAAAVVANPSLLDHRWDRFEVVGRMPEGAAPGWVQNPGMHGAGSEVVSYLGSIFYPTSGQNIPFYDSWGPNAGIEHSAVVRFWEPLVLPSIDPDYGSLVRSADFAVDGSLSVTEAYRATLCTTGYPNAIGAVRTGSPQGFMWSAATNSWQSVGFYHRWVLTGQLPLAEAQAALADLSLQWADVYVEAIPFGPARADANYLVCAPVPGSYVSGVKVWAISPARYTVDVVNISAGGVTTANGTSKGFVRVNYSAGPHPYTTPPTLYGTDPEDNPIVEYSIIRLVGELQLSNGATQAVDFYLLGRSMVTW